MNVHHTMASLEQTLYLRRNLRLCLNSVWQSGGGRVVDARQTRNFCILLFAITFFKYSALLYYFSNYSVLIIIAGCSTMHVCGGVNARQT